MEDVKTIRLGNAYDDEKFNGGNFGGNVWDSEGLAPTMKTGASASQQCTVEIKKMKQSEVIGGFGDKKSNGGSQYYQQDRVYEMGDVAMCHPANIPGGSYNYLEVKKMCPQIVAMRGRGDNNEQQLEIQKSGCTNTITSVAKDNLVMERVIVQKCGDRDKEGGYTVHDYSNCIPANPMSDRGQMVVETDKIALRMVRTEEGKALRKDYESGRLHHGYNEYREAEPRKDGCVNTLSTVQKDNIVLETDKINRLGGMYGQATRWGVYSSENSAPTLTASMDEGGGHTPMVVEETQIFAIDEQNNSIRTETFGTVMADGSSPKHNNRVGEAVNIKIRQATKQGYIECPVGGVCDLSYPSSKIRRARVQGNGEISPALTTESIPNIIELSNSRFAEFIYEINGETYLIRIRKLTPKETWRLQGFDDWMYEKAASVNSNTQLYKQSGNSITVDVLAHIFENLFKVAE